MDDPSVEKAFLEELEALEKFRISYTGAYPSVPLSREDPDVRRLIEALAFFSARTRVAAQRSVNESLLWLFRQHFPYVIAPMPAMGILQASPTSSFVDVLELPRGMDVAVDTKAQRAEHPTYRFRTTAPLRILPIELTSVELMRRQDKSYRILLRFEGQFPRNDRIDTISLHINHLNDLSASMAVLYALQQHVQGVSVTFDDFVREDTIGDPCEVSYGVPEAPSEALDAHEGPIERLRALLHFPQAELFMRISGIAHKRNWKRFALCLDVDDKWPAEMRLTADTFVLNAVPIVNIKRDMANPILCDGTRERYLVRHPDPAARFVPHSILGVYRLLKEGMTPLEPGVLGVTTAGWESSFEGREEARVGSVHLTLPEAFERPERIAVEAFWMQPSILGLRAEEVQVRPSERYVEGVTWAITGAFAPPADNEIADDRDGLLGMVALKSQRTLGVHELTFLLRVLGSFRRPEFARLTNGIKEVRLSTKPTARRAGGTAYVYDIEFQNLDASDIPRLSLLCARLLPMLEAWSVEYVVEVIVRVPRLGHEARFVR